MSRGHPLLSGGAKEYLVIVLIGISLITAEPGTISLLDRIFAFGEVLILAPSGLFYWVICFLVIDPNCCLQLHTLLIFFLILSFVLGFSNAVAS